MAYSDQALWPTQQAMSRGWDPSRQLMPAAPLDYGSVLGVGNERGETPADFFNRKIWNSSQATPMTWERAGEAFTGIPDALTHMRDGVGHDVARLVGGGFPLGTGNLLWGDAPWDNSGRLAGGYRNPEQHTWPSFLGDTGEFIHSALKAITDPNNAVGTSAYNAITDPAGPLLVAPFIPHGVRQGKKVLGGLAPDTPPYTPTWSAQRGPKSNPFEPAGPLNMGMTDTLKDWFDKKPRPPRQPDRFKHLKGKLPKKKKTGPND